jgi:hypothetical protein
MTNDDKLAHHIDGLITAVRERGPRTQVFNERTATIPRPTASASFEDLRRWAEEYTAVTEEVMGTVYYRADLHSHAILKLTNDPAITKPVGKLAHALETEISDVRDLISEVGRASTAGDKAMIFFKVLGAGFRNLPRKQEIDAALAELERHRRAA